MLIFPVWGFEVENLRRAFWVRGLRLGSRFEVDVFRSRLRFRGWSFGAQG